MSHFFLKQYAALAMMVFCTAPALSVEQILIESDQVRITGLDLEADLMRIPPELRAEVLSSKARIAKLLENVLINKTLAARARSAGIDREPMMAKQIEMAADKLLAIGACGLFSMTIIKSVFQLITSLITLSTFGVILYLIYRFSILPKGND